MSFKDELKKLRKQDGLTQGELAERLQVGRSTVSMWESGQREPDFETLEKISDYFNVPMSSFFPGTENPASGEAGGAGIFTLYRTLSAEDRQMVDSMILRLASKAGK